MRKLDGSVCDIGQRGGESTLNVFISMRDSVMYVCVYVHMILCVVCTGKV